MVQITSMVFALCASGDERTPYHRSVPRLNPVEQGQRHEPIDLKPEPVYARGGFLIDEKEPSNDCRATFLADGEEPINERRGFLLDEPEPVHARGGFLIDEKEPSNDHRDFLLDEPEPGRDRRDFLFGEKEPLEIGPDVPAVHRQTLNHSGAIKAGVIESFLLVSTVSRVVARDEGRRHGRTNGGIRTGAVSRAQEETHSCTPLRLSTPRAPSRRAGAGRRRLRDARMLSTRGAGRAKCGSDGRGGYARMRASRRRRRRRGDCKRLLQVRALCVAGGTSLKLMKARRNVLRGEKRSSARQLHEGGDPDHCRGRRTTFAGDRGHGLGSAEQNDYKEEYAEKRAEDDQREWRTGDRTGAGGARGRRVRGRASGEKCGLCGGTAEGASDLTGTQARWLSGNKHIGDNTASLPEQCWELDARLWSKPETNGRYTSPSCPHGRGTEPGATETGIHVRAGSWVHVELNLIRVRSMSGIKTAFNDTATDPVERGFNWHFLVSQCEMKTCCHAEAPLSIQVWHPLLTLGTATTTLQPINSELQN
ncbi:hypothetical protein B0H13DRAFT_2509219 [Mycena leptocephala]|nr:hypothetical protein B0H13DRAFT_2509219 [Mycena leptocephala]